MPDTLVSSLLTHVEDEKEFHNSIDVFGEYLRSIRRSQSISVRQLAKAVSITPTYLSDIEKGNNKPPDKNLLDLIIQNLHIDDKQESISKLYDLAAKERHDIPADVKAYIMENPDLLTVIRALKNNPNPQKILKRLSKTI